MLKKIQMILKTVYRQKWDRQKWDGRSIVRSHICRSINGRTFAYRHRQKCDPNYFIKNMYLH